MIQVAGHEGHGDVQVFLELVEEDQRCDKVLQRMEQVRLHVCLL